MPLRKAVSAIKAVQGSYTKRRQLLLGTKKNIFPDEVSFLIYLPGNSIIFYHFGLPYILLLATALITLSALFSTGTFVVQVSKPISKDDEICIHFSQSYLTKPVMLIK